MKTRVSLFTRLCLFLAGVGLTGPAQMLSAAPVHLVDQSPVQISLVAPGVYLVDFGRVAFGNLEFLPPAKADSMLTVYFGEKMAEGRIDRQPPGTVRYHATATRLGGSSVVVAPTPDVRNTWTPGKTDFRAFRNQPLAPASPPPPAILTPEEWGVVLPFRWVEVEGWPGELKPEHIRRRAAFAATWDDSAASFDSSDPMLNRIWELCRYSIKATTFAGIYVDGDRERIPYEADAYLNQLSHYATDRDLQMARDTLDHLMVHGTWPSEWAPHLVFMAYADWRHSGDLTWLATHFEALKSKLLLDRAGPDGLIRSNEAQMGRNDIVDWPKPERDGYVFTPVNTVVNAFHVRTLGLMAEMAGAIGRTDEASHYTKLARDAAAAFQAALFDASRGVYRDGIGTDHVSLHANLFPLAFGLVPAEHRAQVTAYVASRGMACSVYAAQYLLEGLFENEAGTAALDLMTAANDRSWRHMVESGTTITWEAWDQKYKPNQDWNHAWGAAPANLLPRFVLGVEPAAPGWSQAQIRPHPGRLTFASGKIPTPRGPIAVAWENGAEFTLTFVLPPGMTARFALPARPGGSTVTLDGQPVPTRREGSRLLLTQEIAGQGKLVVR
jgi:alpha-L-rhamnosidase